MGQKLPPWATSTVELQNKLKDYPGFETGYQHYLYVLEFDRINRNRPYYYVGKSSSGEDGLFSEIRRRARNPFTFQRPIEYKDTDILTTHRKEEYTVSNVDRIKTLKQPPEAMGEEYANEGERNLSYQIAVAYETTNILGGK